VSNFIVQALRNETITVYGDGSQTRSFCFVSDMIDAFIRLMATNDDVTGPMNLGNPAEQTVLELARQVIEFTGSRSTIEFRPLPINDPVRRKPDISLATATLNWAPHVPIDEGLKKTVEYFEDALTHS